MDGVGACFLSQKQPCSLSGELVHPNALPFNSSHIKLWKLKGPLKYDKLIGDAFTDLEGKFRFDYTASIKGRKSYALTIHEEGITPDIKVETKVDTIYFEVKAKQTMNAGRLEGRMYEVQKNMPIEEPPQAGNERPQSFSRDQLLGIVKAAAPHVALSAILSGLDALGLASASSVQAFFGKNYPKDTLTPELIVEMIVKWAGSDRLVQDKNNPNKFYYPLIWDGIEVKPNTSIECPNAWITLIRENETFKMTEYVLELFGKPITYTLKHQLFQKYLYLLASGIIYDVESRVHLEEHIRSGLRALCTLPPINKHCIKDLLFPALKGVLPIDDAGETLIFGDGVLSLGKFTSDGVNQILKAPLAAEDWNTVPAKPLCEKDIVSKAKKDFWDTILKPSVAQFFKEKNEEMQDHWREIFLMSEHVVHKSPDLCPLPEIRGPFSPSLGIPLSRTVDHSPEGRIHIDGKLKACRPITQSKNSPEKGDLKRLQQYSMDTLMGPFRHYIAHAAQERWVTNLDIGSLGPNNFIHNPDQGKGGTSVHTAKKMLTVAYTLTAYQGTPLIDDPNVYPPYRDAVRAAAPRFKEEYGIDLTKMWADIPI